MSNNRNSISKGTSSATVSEEMKDLLAHQREIKEWQTLVNQRIYDLESSYMDEPSSLGNILRGWDVNGRTFPVRRGPVEDKDRLFSSSSYHIYLNMKTEQEIEAEKKSIKKQLDGSLLS